MSQSRSHLLVLIQVLQAHCFSLLQSIPVHGLVHKEAESLIRLLQLPAFPPISRDCPLHPTQLGLRYLREANLPGNRPGANGALSFTHPQTMFVCVFWMHDDGGDDVICPLLVQTSSTRGSAG